MKIGPLFKWFGSKWQSAKRYPVPEHDTIIEPFAGGAGFSLNYCEKKVFLSDADPHLSELWPWLLSMDPAQILEIPVGLPIGTDIREIGLSDGQALLLKSWQRTNSVGDCWTVSKWGHLPGQWTLNTRARIADQIGAVSHWEFIDFKTCQDMRGVTAHWFLDPPYLYNYRYSRKLPKFDHEQLAQLVNSISKRSTVVVCEAARKSDGVLPDYLPFVATHSSVTSRRKSSQSHHSAECTYIRAANENSMQTNLCILLKRDESIDGWVSHCLELDVVSQGPTIPTSLTAVIEAVEMVIADDYSNGLDPMDRPEAPMEYWTELLNATSAAPRDVRTFTISVEIDRPMIKKRDTVGVLETTLELPIRYVIHSDATFPFKISIFCDRWSEDTEGSTTHKQIPVATWIPQRGLSMVSFAHMLIQEAGLIPQIKEFCEQSYAAYSEEQS